MFWVRFETEGRTRSGILEDGMIREIRGSFFEGGEFSGEVFPLEKVRLLAPVEPTSIFCVGRNYTEHAKELGHDLPEEPLIFLKAPGSVLSPEGTIRIPLWAGRIDYEGELAVVIGKTCRNIPEEKAQSVIFGLTCLNDVTARDLQNRDGQWTRSKSFDTFCPLGPWILKSGEARGRRIETRLNGRVVQAASTDMMIFPVGRLISHISRFATLRPGDVVATGTPAGVGPMLPGDVVEVEIEGIGILKNRVAGDPS
ncbi:MAG: fumarylacetoacetate hydrolase family protein [Synergistaceae bacterium]|nr:fumarylacetoacetate hydrolase family protein [Synergistaceae bacterium]